MTVFLEYLPQIIATSVVLLVVPTIKYLMRKYIRFFTERRGKTEARMLQVIHLTSWVINIFAIFVLIVIWGVKAEDILVALGSVLLFVGVGVFAQWSILSNVTAGLVIFFSTPFRIGDRIEIHDKDLPMKATIEGIMTFYTHLRTDDGSLVVISNTLFLQKTISLLEERIES